MCPGCGYHLRGLEFSERCPECGEPLAPLRSPEPTIPWARRREIGRLRALLATAWLVFFGGRRFHAEMVRPIRYRDAQRFRTVCVWLTTLALLGAVYLLGWLEPRELRDVFQWWWPLLPVPLAWLFIYVASGLPSYFFHPRYLPVEVQNRAIALSHYTSAALLLVPAILVPYALIAVCLVWLDEPYDVWSMRELASNLQLLLLISSLPAALVAYWFMVISLARRVSNRAGRAWLVALAVPALWLAAAVGILVFLPVSFLYIPLLFRSFL